MNPEPTTNHQPPATTFSPKQVAAKLGVGIAKVLGWIRRGQLTALDVASDPGPGRRHRWRIAAEALQTFEEQRATGHLPVKPVSKQTSRKPTRNVEKFL